MRIENAPVKSEQKSKKTRKTLGHGMAGSRVALPIWDSIMKSVWADYAPQAPLPGTRVVLKDPFGAATEKVWILNQWLPELVMHWAHAAYGLPGVAFLLCLGSLLVGLSVFAACRRRAAPLATALVLAVVFVALSGSLYQAIHQGHLGALSLDHLPSHAIGL